MEMLCSNSMCLCVYICVCNVFAFLSLMIYHTCAHALLCVCVNITFKNVVYLKCFLCKGFFVFMYLYVSICVSVSLYFCVCLCVSSSHVLVGPVQGAPSVWAHVRPAVGRPLGRLWQREDPGVLWPQHSQRLLLFLQVQDKITLRVLIVYFRRK